MCKPTEIQFKHEYEYIIPGPDLKQHLLGSNLQHTHETFQ